MSNAATIFQLFDCDKSGTLSPVEFCAGIALLREKAGSDAGNKKLTDDFMAAAGKKGGLWDIMFADAGWSSDSPVMQLPYLTPALWQTFLDTTDSDEALEKYVSTFYGDTASFHGELTSDRLVGIGERMLKSSKRGSGNGDFFDLIDADLSGALSAQEMMNTCAAMKKAVPAKSALVSYWEQAVIKLYKQMARDAGWPADTKPSQMPHLKRPLFEKFWAEQKVQLEMFATLVDECCNRKAEIQALAVAWNGMEADTQANWVVLGWSQHGWDNRIKPDTEDTDWGELSAPQQKAAAALGFTQEKWDGD